MKYAKVVSAQEVRAKDACDPWLTDKEQRARAEELLLRYPATTEGEVAEIRLFLTKGRHYDVGMVEGSNAFRDKVAAFGHAHMKQSQLTPAQLVVALMLALLAALASWLLTI